MKYLITWDVGYGTNFDTIEADTFEEAEEMAYECWREDAESNANYSAEIWTEEAEEMLK